MTTIFDIAPPVRAGIAVYPGDTPYKAARTGVISDDCPLNVGELSMSCHCGAQAGSPLHHDKDGASIDQLDLADFVGPARVSDAQGPEEKCSLKDLEGFPTDGSPRILPRLAGAIDPVVLPEGFRAMSTDAISFLADQDVELVGVDVPTADRENSEKLPIHEIARSRDLQILENLALSAVEPGYYELIALPMELEGLDAAPVRAILRPF
ncbi:MAG: cyclase family protein [Pseudomonadota bacterium]